MSRPLLGGQFLHHVAAHLMATADLRGADDLVPRVDGPGVAIGVLLPAVTVTVRPLPQSLIAIARAVRSLAVDVDDQALVLLTDQDPCAGGTQILHARVGASVVPSLITLRPANQCL